MVHLKIGSNSALNSTRRPDPLIYVNLSTTLTSGYESFADLSSLFKYTSELNEFEGLEQKDNSLHGK